LIGDWLWFYILFFTTLNLLPKGILVGASSLHFNKYTFMKNLPYVVSADIYLLLTKWAKLKGFTLPKEEFFIKLRKEFSSYMSKIFPNFELISEKEILEHSTNIVLNNNLNIISLDTIYFSGDYLIELTRSVSSDGLDKGLRHRFGSDTLLRQLNTLKNSGIKEVGIYDDVIFSGVLAERIIRLLSTLGINVSKFYAGIGIKEGIDKIENLLSIEVNCAHVYNQVVDEVCERDFYLGIPFSGRSLIDENNLGLSYLLPFGKPEAWASIPSEYQETFSIFCINQTIKLFEEIENSSNKIVYCSDIDRKVPNQPKIGRYVDFLKSIHI
jgi:hypothetical protein